MEFLNVKDGEVKHIEAKSILSKLRQSDPWFGISYNMNLYRGCQHACIYCDTRSECYGIGDISKVSVKSNALGLLRQELKRKQKNKATIGTGSMNDPYMPLERQTGMVRGALHLLAEHRFPVHIITKSDLVLRDADVLKEISRVYAAVSFTITTPHDEMSQRIEPGAPPSSLRLKALAELAGKGIYAGVTLMPLLPYITDRPEDFRELLHKIKDAGTAYIIFMPGMTLRKGSREYFYSALDEEFPGMKSRYETTFGYQYECTSPAHHELYSILKEERIPTRMEFYSPDSPEQLSLFTD